MLDGLLPDECLMASGAGEVSPGVHGEGQQSIKYTSQLVEAWKEARTHANVHVHTHITQMSHTVEALEARLRRGYAY